MRGSAAPAWSLLPESISHKRVLGGNGFGPATIGRASIPLNPLTHAEAIEAAEERTRRYAHSGTWAGLVPPRESQANGDSTPRPKRFVDASGGMV